VIDKDLNGAEIAIVGLGGTQGTFTSSAANGKVYDEVWAINSMMVPIKHDRVFMMDPAARFLDTVRQHGFWIPRMRVPRQMR